MADVVTQNLGLHVNGPLATGVEGDPSIQAWQTDLNFQTIDAVSAMLLAEIAGISITGLPPVVDAGTF